MKDHADARNTETLLYVSSHLAPPAYDEQVAPEASGETKVIIVPLRHKQ